MLFKKLIKKYNYRYSIPYIDLADAGESNRIIVHLASIFLFLIEAVGFSVFCICYRSELSTKIDYLIYYAVFIIVSVYGFFASRQDKDIDRKKIYVHNAFPMYIMMYVIFWVETYNVLTGGVYTGFVTFCVTAFVGLCTCSFSPILFFIGLSIPAIVMSPSIYRTFGLSGLMDSLIAVILMFCLSLYKRRTEKKHIMFMKKQKQNLQAKTFGNFTLMFENKVVKFSRSKSEELMGYLIYKKGSSVKTKELITALYGEHADSARYGSSLRNLIVDIKHTMAELEIQNFFIAEYNNFRINPEVIRCDYYDFLEGDPAAIKSFGGEFMSQYSWAEDTISFLEQKALQK